MSAVFCLYYPAVCWVTFPIILPQRHLQRKPSHGIQQGGMQASTSSPPCLSSQQSTCQSFSQTSRSFPSKVTGIFSSPSALCKGDTDNMSARDRIVCSRKLDLRSNGDFIKFHFKTLQTKAAKMAQWLRA